ncbi:pyridoxal-phosphate dependent enzyme [Sphaerisporangium sp. NPDC051017]|uniref:1-aminocyclopropane-1-carboxylate deaminase/D-cysteine desulfhydrase n=1 Tax=Sphaerisporangium sp. NPDC051017 TaxID=3154636 RepID=UPI0034132D6F
MDNRASSTAEGLPGLRLPSPMEEVDDPRLGGVRLFLKRDDLLHSDLPGNKWRKLKDNLAEAARQGAHTLLTFGGAYSNHVRAMAAAGRHFGFATIGVIRGEEHLPLNPSLAYAVARGMRLAYLDRTTYRAKNDPEVIARLREEHGDFHLIPEGGSNAWAVRGCAELPAEVTAQLGGDGYDVICCACGTGGTLAGIAAGLPPGRRALGFSVLKGGEFLAGEVERLRREAYGTSSPNYTLEHGFHFGGYARIPAELDDFARDFAARHGHVLERIYVAKMLYGVFALAARGAFAPGTRIVAVVTGGAAPWDDTGGRTRGIGGKPGKAGN